MLKLYKLTDGKKMYWESWENGDGSHTIHLGELGTDGITTSVTSTTSASALEIIQKDIALVSARGFRAIPLKDHSTLLIEYAVDGFGTTADLEKRHRLEARMNETLGWTGLGVCDGGSVGNGTMEVCNFVVDFEIAKSLIERDLAGTEFANYVGILDENTT